MGDAKSKPPIKPHQCKDGSWCAEVAWPSVPTSHLGSFKREIEVEDWITRKSDEYFQKIASSIHAANIAKLLELVQQRPMWMHED